MKKTPPRHSIRPGTYFFFRKIALPKRLHGVITRSAEFLRLMDKGTERTQPNSPHCNTTAQRRLLTRTVCVAWRQRSPLPPITTDAHHSSVLLNSFKVVSLTAIFL
jgi:hypothetical protein